MRTVIVGNSGSGKSWLAKRLGERTFAQVIHLDEIFWLPGGFNEKRSSSEVQNLVDSRKVDPDWIVEGVFCRFGETIFVFGANIDMARFSMERVQTKARSTGFREQIPYGSRAV